MANTTQKALDLASMIQEELLQRLAVLSPAVIVGAVSFDTDSNPLIQIGTGAAGQKGGVIKVLPTAWPTAKDILGNAAIQYGPHTIQICTETNTAAGSDINDPSVLMPMLIVCALKGARFEWYKTANTVAPIAGSLIAANLKQSFESMQYPLISMQ